jgi:hypothetical protein
MNENKCEIKCGLCGYQQNLLPLTINIGEAWKISCESCNEIMLEVMFVFDGRKLIQGMQWNIFEDGNNPKDIITWSRWEKTRCQRK